MASSVYYKFKSQRDESKITFDGTGISVFDLKKEVILANNLKANDFDLVVLDPASQQEVDDDSHIIPRSSSIIVKRVPARSGRGKAAMYASGIPPHGAASAGGSGSTSWNRNVSNTLSKRFDGKDEQPHKSSTPVPTLGSNVTEDEEAAAVAAMFKAQTENWEETQEKMSQATRIYSNNARGTGRGRGMTRPPLQPDRPLPPSYVCYRCGQKGHWIQDCPTNNDREFDNRPRIKRTTGIPRSFLKAVDNPLEGQPGQGVMITPDGGYVVAQPDAASWKKHVSRPKILSESDIRERPNNEPVLLCPIDNKLFRDAVKTPCCGTVFCEECIQTYLLEHDFNCRHCGKKVASLDKLTQDKITRSKVANYIEQAIMENQEVEEGSTFPIVSATAEVNAASDAPADDQNNLEQYVETQFGPDFDNSQVQDIIDNIPQLQAQINQISVMLQNPALPLTVQQSTRLQYQQLQIQLQQAQALAIYASGMGTQGTASDIGIPSFNPEDFAFQQQWAMPYPDQQPPNADAPYQRLPLNNRRRPLKRDRPSDFLEVSSGPNKSPRA